MSPAAALNAAALLNTAITLMTSASAIVARLQAAHADPAGAAVTDDEVKAAVADARAAVDALEKA